MKEKKENIILGAAPTSKVTLFVASSCKRFNGSMNYHEICGKVIVQ